MKESSPKKPDKKSESLQIVPKPKLGRPCSICSHLEVKKINSAIGKGKSFRAISCQIQGNESMRESIRRHAENCLKIDLRAVLEEKRINQTVEHYQELMTLLNDAKRIKKAVFELFTDTKTGELTFIAAAHEYEVLYPDFGDLNDLGFPKQKRAKLSDVILSIAKQISGFEYATYKVTVQNRFEAALKVIDAIDKLLDKFARVDGHYQKERENEETLNRVAKAFMNWREDNPDMPIDLVPKWLLRFAENSGVDAKRLADRVGIEIS